MQKAVRPIPTMKRTVRVPADKSISHRAFLLSSVAEGESRFTGVLEGADVLSTLECMRALGVEITREGPGDYTIAGRGFEGLREPSHVLDAGNSGTTIRLLCGLLAGRDFFSVITGDASLRSRPMGRVVEPLEKMGARIDGRRGGTLAPVALRGGRLRAIDYASPIASAQVKSAILLAALQAEGSTRIVEPERSRDHTERMLTAMGASLEVKDREVILPGRQLLRPVRAAVPGDISSAAFFLVAGLILPDAEIRITGVNLNPTRTGILDILAAMGGDIKVEGVGDSELGEPVGDLVVRSSELRGVEIAPAMVPRALDELPVIAVAAAAASGTTVVRGAAELRHKESDRIAAMVTGLSRMGAAIEELPDGFRVEGPARLTGARLDSFGDHRIAMALAVAGAAARGESAVDGAESVGISFPGFWEMFSPEGEV